MVNIIGKDGLPRVPNRIEVDCLNLMSRELLSLPDAIQYIPKSRIQGIIVEMRFFWMFHFFFPHLLRIAEAEIGKVLANLGQSMPRTDRVKLPHQFEPTVRARA